MNPLGKIPILEHEDLVVPDSSVIVAYIERLYPTPALYPEDPKEMARALFYQEFGESLSIAGETIDASRWPKLSHYAAKLLSRPSIEKAGG